MNPVVIHLKAVENLEKKMNREQKKMFLPKIPSEPLKFNQLYVAELFPEEGIIFGIGSIDAEGAVWEVKSSPPGVEDIDFTEVDHESTSKIKKLLVDAGWHVVIDR